jgi:hypothetical protein
LVDVPQWPNKHLLPLLIKDKQKALEESPCMKALVKHVAKFYRAGLETMNVYEKYNDVLTRGKSIGSPLLFVHDTVHAKTY